MISPGVSKGSVTGPMMGCLRVVECRLLRMIDPRTCWHQSPGRWYCGQLTILSRAAAPKWVPRWCGRRRRATVGLQGVLPGQVLQHFAEQTIEDVARRKSSRSSPRARWGFNSASWSRTALRGSGGAGLRRERARAVLTRKPWHFLRAPLYVAVALVFCVSQQRLLDEFLAVFQLSEAAILRSTCRSHLESGHHFYGHFASGSPLSQFCDSLRKPFFVQNISVFLREGELGSWRSHFQRTAVTAFLRRLKGFFTICRTPSWWTWVPIFQPSMTHSCELSRASGLPELPEVLLPGDSAHVCAIRS